MGDAPKRMFVRGKPNRAMGCWHDATSLSETAAMTSDGSNPMFSYILSTPEALAASPEVQKLVAEAEARGMERAAKLVPTGYTFWAKKPHNARWARKIDGTPIPNDLPVCIQEIIHAEAAAIRRAEGAPK